jgi:phosphopantetheine--protein transferase-like protein
MPLTLHNNIDNETSFALWKIEEPVDFFAPHFLQNSDIQNEAKRIQWYASRHLLNHVTGSKSEILKSESGKPYIAGNEKNISISHTQHYAAAMLSSISPVGIDIEIVHPKIERIAHKFLTTNELSAIVENEKIEKLILYWSAKEALFKLYGKGGVDFKTQLLIEPFNLCNQGKLRASILKEKNISGLEIEYSFFDNHVLTYVVGR